MASDYLDKVRLLMQQTFDAVNYEDLANRIVKEYSSLLNSEAATLWRKVVDENGVRFELASSCGINIAPGEKIPTYKIPSGQAKNEELEGITSWIAFNRQPCIANSFYELAEDKTKPWYGTYRGKWDHNPFWTKNPKTGKLDAAPEITFGSFLGIPLIHENNLLGVLKVENRIETQHFYNEQNLELAQHLAPFIAMSIAGMEEREKHERDRQQVLRSLSSGLLELDPAKFYQRIVDTTAELLKAKICSLWLVDETKKILRLGANYGVSPEAKKSPPTYDLKWNVQNDREIEGITAWVAIRRKPYFAGNHETLRKHPSWKGKWDPLQWRGEVIDEFGSLYAVPLIRGEEVLGVLKIENDREKGRIDEVDRATFDLVGDFVTLALELSGWLRADVVFDFFHLLKEPTAMATMAVEDLQRELSRKGGPRSSRINARLEMLAKNLATVRVWTMNVYGLATARDTGKEDKKLFKLNDLLSENVINIQRLFPQFSYEFKGDPQNYSLFLTDLERKKADVVFYNILDNCNKFSGQNPKVIIKINHEDGTLAIAIRDHGRGISPEALPRIFDPYYTSSMDEWPESMGLGLSTVNRVLKELHWDKEVWTEEGSGTEITIYIPKINYEKEEKNDVKK